VMCRTKYRLFVAAAKSFDVDFCNFSGIGSW